MPHYDADAQYEDLSVTIDNETMTASKLTIEMAEKISELHESIKIVDPESLGEGEEQPETPDVYRVLVKMLATVFEVEEKKLLEMDVRKVKDAAFWLIANLSIKKEGEEDKDPTHGGEAGAEPSA